MSDLDKIKVTTLDKEHYKISRDDFYLITKEYRTLEAKVRELLVENKKLKKRITKLEEAINQLFDDTFGDREE